MPKRAFTLIELLVVLGIIAVLLTVLLPALASVRHTAQRMSELAAAKQVMTVYIAYSSDHRDHVLEGHLNTSGSIPTIHDAHGEPITQNVVIARWVWPLLAYSDHQLGDSLFVNEQYDALWSQTDLPFWHYNVSVLPSFGMNLYQIGGDNRSLGSANASDLITKTMQAHDPARMIVFASSGSAGPNNTTTYGYWRINPPTRPYEGGATGWTSDEYQNASTESPERWGWVHPRWDKNAITAHLDGHAETMSHQQLRDMTYWSNAAAERNDPNYTPTP